MAVWWYKPSREVFGLVLAKDKFSSWKNKRARERLRG